MIKKITLKLISYVLFVLIFAGGILLAVSNMDIDAILADFETAVSSPWITLGAYPDDEVVEGGESGGEVAGEENTGNTESNN